MMELTENSFNINTQLIIIIYYYHIAKPYFKL